MKPFFTKTLRSWKEIEQYQKLHWIYRGQRCIGGRKDKGWGLKTLLERFCNQNAYDVIKTEEFLLREFKRSYHQYAPQKPQPNSTIEWLALMQHHGAPTRLLDFTYSIYVAAYFALEEADQKKDDFFEIWAIWRCWAESETIRKMERSGKPYADVLSMTLLENDEQIVNLLFFRKPYVKAVCALNPFHLNERLRAQQGVFLVPGDISDSFMNNLKELRGHRDRRNVVRLLVPCKHRDKMLHMLYDMNISRTSLFPGLDGYARTLGVYHPALPPRD